MRERELEPKASGNEPPEAHEEMVMNDEEHVRDGVTCPPSLVHAFCETA
jgi:hypothetical protein